jgi:hypothetical protein
MPSKDTKKQGILEKIPERTVVFEISQIIQRFK